MSIFIEVLLQYVSYLADWSIFDLGSDSASDHDPISAYNR